MISTLIFFLTMSTISAEPLNVQNAVDLDEMDVDISATASSTSNKHNIIMGSETSKSISRPGVASATVEGDVTVMPLSSTPIDMSVIPEPVPKVDGVEPSSLPFYGGIGSIIITGQHLGTEAGLDQEVSINGRACNETKWISVTNLECIGPASFTVGTKALVQVNVARSRSDPDSDGVTVEYEPPVVSRIVTSVVPTNGNTSIRVIGRNLGDIDVAGAEQPLVTIGTVPCTHATLINSTEIHCETGQLDDPLGPLVLTVTVDGVTSNATTYSINATAYNINATTYHINATTYSINGTTYSINVTTYSTKAPAPAAPAPAPTVAPAAAAPAPAPAQLTCAYLKAEYHRNECECPLCPTPCTFIPRL